MTEFQVFRCCPQHPLSASPEDAAPPSAGAWVAPVSSASPINYLSGPPIDGRTVRLSRSRSTAFHEAAHAAVYVALGSNVLVATIDGQPHVKPGTALAYPANIIAVLAGDAGAAWVGSELARAPVADLAGWVGGIRNLCGGSCDRCKAIRNCLVGTRHASDAEVIAAFRHLENVTGMIVRSPRVWAAITDLADALMARGTIRTRTINAICRRHFKPGDFAHLVNPNPARG